MQNRAYPGADYRWPLAVGTVIALAVIAWANANGGQFQFDDHLVIVRESTVQSVAAWANGLPSIRPLLKLSYALNHELGAGIRGFHLVNLAIHAVNAWLVFALARRLAAGCGQDDSAARSVALLTAALFALHPVQTEAVTYVSGRSTSLAALFALASLLTWLQRDERRGATAAASGLLALGLMCKEYVAVVPLAMVLTAAVVDRHPRRWPRTARALVAPCAIVVIAALAAAAVPRYQQLLWHSLALRDVADNLAAQVHGLAWLAGQLIRLDRLNADPALAAQPLGLNGALLLVAVVLLVATATALYRRQPAFLFGLLWFLLWLAPTQSVLPRADLVNERHLYLPIIGPAFIASLYLVAAVRSAILRAGLAALVLVTLAVVTHQRNALYADEVRYWTDAASKSPHNARAMMNLGLALAERCRIDEARIALDAARALAPESIQPAANRMLLDSRSDDCRATAPSTSQPE